VDVSSSVLLSETKVPLGDGRVLEYSIAFASEQQE
jgi:hypothetical protein